MICINAKESGLKLHRRHKDKEGQLRIQIRMHARRDCASHLIFLKRKREGKKGREIRESKKSKEMKQRTNLEGEK
jgi:hypothetical protein